MLYLTRGFVRKSAEIAKEFRCHDGRYSGGIIAVYILISEIYVPFLLALDLITLPLQIVGATIAWAMNRRDSK